MHAQQFFADRARRSRYSAMLILSRILSKKILRASE